MKYFTPELHVRMQDFTSDAAMNAAEAASEAAAEQYKKHLANIEPEMPDYFHPFRSILLHGARVWCLSRRGEELIMVLHKDIPPRDVVILSYQLANEPSINREAFPPLYRSSVMDFLYDELDLITEGGEKHMVQSILFSNGWEIRLRFRDVQVKLTAPLYPVPGAMMPPTPSLVVPQTT